MSINTIFTLNKFQSSKKFLLTFVRPLAYQTASFGTQTSLLDTHQVERTKKSRKTPNLDTKKSGKNSRKVFAAITLLKICSKSSHAT